MAHYVVGDVQGCYSTLRSLLKILDFNFGKDTVWFAGDLVNRGPESLETLRFIRRHDSCMQTVLGNHDLYLLYLANRKNITYKKKDTIDSIIEAEDAKKLINWLRTRPLYLQNDAYVVVHAGVFPDWSLQDMVTYGDEISFWLKSKQYVELLNNMFGNLPSQYSRDLHGFERLRFSINVFTRMRALYRCDKSLDFEFKSTLADMPFYLDAWFNFDNDKLHNKKILFGHWSAINLHKSDYATSLDTGAVWGGSLTAYNLHTQETVSVRNDS